jgi:O-methyltransferase domain/Dimerisation domain
MSGDNAQDRLGGTESAGTAASAARAEDARGPGAAERAAAADLLQLIWGLHISRAVYLAAELGIADLIADGALTAAALAAATQTDESSLYRVLRLLAALGVLTEYEPRSFGLTLLGERLRTNVPASMRNWARLADTVGFAAYEPIIEAVRTGMSGMDIASGHDASVWDQLHADRERAARFDATMAERTAAFAPGVAALDDFARMGVLADVGGGQGTLLAAILQRHRHLRGILVERQAVTDRAAAVLQDAGVANRCEIVAADFFAGVPAGADCYLLANVLHDWDDDRAVAILRECREAAGAGGRVFVVERLIPDDLRAAVPVLLSDLNMLMVTGGRERTNDEYARLLAAAGLRCGRIRPVAAPYGVIEGLRSA